MLTDIKGRHRESVWKDLGHIQAACRGDILLPKRPRLTLWGGSTAELNVPNVHMAII